jgi:hypothetical protein
MPHPYLVPVAELPRYGIEWSFLEQFRPRPIEILISTAGALGTMRFKWRLVGDTNFSAEIPSSAAAPWVFALDEAFAVLTFGAGGYVLDSTYVISEAGGVTTGGGAINTLTASRYDRREAESQVTTDLCIGWMQPAITPPLVSWGADVKGQYALVLRGRLKRGAGLAPSAAAVGDENVIASEEKAEAWFKAVGAGEIEPQDLVDSSSDGETMLVMPISDEPVGW